MTHLRVLYGCDDNYAPYAGVSMTSLFESNRDLDEITVYFAGADIAPANAEKLEQLARSYGRAFHFLDCRSAMRRAEEYRLGVWNNSLATWLRFFVFDQIPEEADRLIWLDSDTLVLDSLRSLCGMPLEGFALAAACDSMCLRARYELGFSEEDPYFNAGVLVFNLACWRQENIEARMMDFLGRRAALYARNDQDLLNDCLKGRIARLHPRWNCQGTLMAYRPRDYLAVYRWKGGSYYDEAELEQALARPAVVHFFRFLGDYPWQAGDNLHPAKPLYEAWKARSPWRGLPAAPRRNGTLFAAEKLLYRLLPRRLFLRLFFLAHNRGLPKRPTPQPPR